jgi:hypothetical protein
MNVSLNRIFQTDKSTIGTLIAGDKQVYTLEDVGRNVKIPGETRIPAGMYAIKLRKEGGFHNRYSSIFGAWHKGMLWLQGVPNFEFILIHMGNTNVDTQGCILVGMSYGRDRIGNSRDAYRLIYPEIADAILEGHEVTIDITDP